MGAYGPRGLEAGGGGALIEALIKGRWSPKEAKGIRSKRRGRGYKEYSIEY